jgi:ATP-dependent DNA helicase MPH1
MEIPVENSQVDLPEPRKRRRVPKMPPKKFHMPDGVQIGFIQASVINGKTTKTKQKSTIEPDIAPLPTLESVLLSKKDEMELDQRYCNVGGSTPQYVQRPRFDVFPEAQREARPTSKVGHSRPTHKLVKCLDTMQRPFDHPPSCDTIASFEKVLAVSRRGPRGPRVAKCSLARSIGSRGSSSTVAPGEAASEDGESSVRNGSQVRDDHGRFCADFSPISRHDPQRSQAGEEHPFYVSQKSNAEHHGSDDELPDVGNLVSVKTNRVSILHLTEEASRTKAPGARSRRRPRLIVDESDDE